MNFYKLRWPDKVISADFYSETWAKEHIRREAEINGPTAILTLVRYYPTCRPRKTHQ